MQAAHLAQRFNSTFDGLCAERNEDEALHNCVADFRLWWIEDLCSVYLEVIKDRLRSSEFQSKNPKVLYPVILVMLCCVTSYHKQHTMEIEESGISLGTFSINLPTYLIVSFV